MTPLRYAVAACQTALPNPVSRREMRANTDRMLSMVGYYPGWDGLEIERDYYQAVDAAGARLWIFRERGPRGGAWYLHGFFG